MMRWQRRLPPQRASWEVTWRAKAGIAEPTDAGGVALVAGQHHAHRGPEGHRVQRLGGGVQHGRPGALQQVAQLLAAGTGGGGELDAAGAELPQPGPDLVSTLGQVAAQLTHQPGDHHGVFGVGLGTGEVLAFAGAGDQQRLHAHQVHPQPVAQLSDDPPAVPGRLAAHHDAGKAVLDRDPSSPAQRLLQLPGVTAHTAAGEHPRVMVTQRQRLLGVGQVDGQDRPVVAHHPAQPDQSGVAARVTPRQAVTLTHGHPPVWLGHQARSPHQGDVPFFNHSRSY